VTGVHQLAKLDNLLIFAKGSIITDSLEIVDSLSLTEDVVSSLIQVVCSVLALYLIDVRNLSDQVKGGLMAGVISDHTDCVPARLKATCHFFEHLLQSQAKGLLDLLEGRVFAVHIVLAKAFL